MDTNRLGNLKRFFSINDSDRVLDVDVPEKNCPDQTSEENFRAMKNTAGKYDYIFWNRGEVKPEREMGISLKNLFCILSEAGKLVLYFDNPCSIHNFAQGADGLQEVSGLSYPLIRQQIREFCREEGVFARWYYPYPNVEFPCMFFSDERLPEKGECDENFYHFHGTRVEVFDEKEAVDALTDGGMYPYLAHAYMIVLSRKELADMPLYTRFSNERREDKQIRTDLTRNEVKKTAVCRKAAEHIRQMTGHENQLQEILGGLRILGRPCEINRLTGADAEEMSATFAYVSGESLESVLDGMLARGREKEVAEALLDVCGQLRKLEDLKSFTVTEDFEEVFGKLPDAGSGETEECLSTGWMALPVTDIDMVCQNILLSDKAVIIDYEWTFSFPVPLDYLIFRFLYFYLEAKMRNGMEREVFADIYTKAGITEEAKECFLAMETHFQRYVQKGAAVLRNEFDARGGGLIGREEFALWRKEKDARRAYVIYEDGSRADVREKRGKEGISTFLVPVKGSKSLQFCFSAQSPVLRIGAMTERAGRQEGISFSTGAMSLGGLLYWFEDGQVTITLEGLTEEDYQLLISAEEVKMSPQAVEELVKNITDLHFLTDNRQQQLEGLKNSASWKLTRPLRMLKGNKEE